MSVVKLELSEEHRQIVILALAELALERPGWKWPIEEIVSKLSSPVAVDDAQIMFDRFKHSNADRIRPLGFGAENGIIPRGEGQ